MIRIIGHGILSRFACELEIDRPILLGELVERIGMSPDLVKDVVFVKGHFVIDGSTVIKDGDEIHLFLVMCGG